MKRTISLVLSIIMVLSMFTGMAVTNVSAVSFTPRLTAPDYNNPYYIHTSYGGLNSCIHISGGSCLPNCVGYAWGRAYEILGTIPNLARTNANTWYSYNINNGYYAYGSTPKVGAIMCWTGGTEGGHVAVVEKIENGVITISESNYGGARFVVKSGTQSEIEAHARNFQGYIYLGDFTSNGYVDLGTEFYASISHYKSWNYLTAEDNDNVSICGETYKPNQYWKFFRQNDASYKIVSASNGKCLEVAGGSPADSANIQVYEDNGTDAQRWFITRCGDGYQLRAKCTDCVIEMNAWNFYEGVNVVSGTRDNSDAEIFSINFRNFNEIGNTTLNVDCYNGLCEFYWNNSLCATNYNIKIWYGDRVLDGEAFQ